jgi:hypothetical protein
MTLRLERTLAAMDSLVTAASTHLPDSGRRRWCVAAGLAGVAVWAGGCAGFGGQPLNVALVGVEPLGGEGLELRLLVKLRLQNPGETDLSFDGVSLDLDMRGQRLASGVSREAGTLPRYGEKLLAVPVSVSGLAVLREALVMLRQGGEPRRIEFAARGRLGGNALGGRSFVTRAEIDWPPVPAGSAPTAPRP